MSDEFNPYQHWLGLHVSAPASHYELLGLRPFESEIHVISAAANNAMTRVRGVQPGPYTARWTQLLDEITAAWNCLADPSQRMQYDNELRQRYGTLSPGSMPSRPLPRAADGSMPPGPSQGSWGAAPMAGYPQASPQAPGAPYGAVAPGIPRQGLPPSQPSGAASDSYYAPPTGQPFVPPPAQPYTPPPGQPYLPQGQIPGQPYGATPQPMAGQPVAPQPMTGVPPPGQPLMGQPVAAQPYAAQPYAVPPTPVQPATVQPATVQPATVQPATVQPATVQPATVQPQTHQAGPSQPAGGYPVQGAPGTPAPMAGYPAAPTAYAPATVATPQPATSPPPSVSSPQLPNLGGSSQAGHLPSDADPMAPVNQVLVTPVGRAFSSGSATPTVSVQSRGLADVGLPPGGRSASTRDKVNVNGKPADATSASAKKKRRIGVPAIGAIVGAVLCAAIVGLMVDWGGDSGENRETANADARDSEGDPVGLPDGSDAVGDGELDHETTVRPASESAGPTHTTDHTGTSDIAVASVSTDESAAASEDVEPDAMEPGSQPPDTVEGEAHGVATAGLDERVSADVPTATEGTPDPLSTVGPGPHPGSEIEAAKIPTDPVLEGLTQPAGTSVAGGGSAASPSGGGSPALPALSERELVDLGRALTRARMYMGAQDYGNSSRELQRAEQLARRPEHLAKVERLKQLSNYTQQFWAAFRDGLKLLNKPGQELVLNGERIAVVEVDARKIILRARGQNKTFPMSDLPDKLVMAIADLWFDKGAASTNVFRGAFYASGPNANPAEARRLWEQARGAGADVADLLPVLDDQYDLTAELNR